MPSLSQVVVVRTLMAAPKSTNTLGKEHPFIFIVTIGFPGSSYFTSVSLHNNKSDNVLATWIVGVTFIFLVGFLVQNSLMVFA